MGRLDALSNRVLAAAGLALLVVGVATAVITGLGAGGDDATEAAPTPAPPTTTTPPKPPAPKQVAVKLRGVSGYDPEGDGREGDDTAQLAADGKPATFWTTERYTTFFKAGVGLLLDAGSPFQPTKIVVITDTPGITASIRIGQSATGPFTAVTPAKRLTAQTTFAPQARKGRYVVVWVESLPDGGTGHVNEVRAFRSGASG